MRVDLPGKLLTGVPVGRQEWKVTSKYDPAGFLLAESTWPRVSLNVEKLSGHYRITLNGAVVNSQTTDNMLNTDGWGDEVQFFGETIVFDRGPQEPVMLRCGEVDLSEGVMGHIGNHVSVRVSRPLNPPKVTMAAFEALDKPAEGR